MNKAIVLITALITSSGTSITKSTDTPEQAPKAIAWTSKQITYSFVNKSYFERNIASPALVNPLATKIKGITLDEAKRLTRKAAATWSKYSNLNITEMEDNKNVNIRIGATNLKGDNAGYGYLPGTLPINGDIHIDNSNRTWTSAMYYKVILHEIGHAIGLIHSNDSNSIMYHKITRTNKPNSNDSDNIKEMYK